MEAFVPDRGLTDIFGTPLRRGTCVGSRMSFRESGFALKARDGYREESSLVTGRSQPNSLLILQDRVDVAHQDRREILLRPAGQVDIDVRGGDRQRLWPMRSGIAMTFALGSRADDRSLGCGAASKGKRPPPIHESALQIPKILRALAFNTFGRISSRMSILAKSDSQRSGVMTGQSEPNSILSCRIELI